MVGKCNDNEERVSFRAGVVMLATVSNATLQHGGGEIAELQ